MVQRGKAGSKASRSAKPSTRKQTAGSGARTKKIVVSTRSGRGQEPPDGKRKGRGGIQQGRRRELLHRMLLQKRQEIMNEIKEDLGQSVTGDQLRRLEGMDSGDQALMDLERELGISLSEMRNRKRQLIDEALIRVEDGSYGVCAECGIEISEKRLDALPFAKLCVECQSKEELLEKIEKEEERE